MPRPEHKFIAWSFDETEDQTFVDIVKAKTPKQAAAKIRKARPYATLDLYVPPMRLDAYVEHLKAELDKP